MIDPKLNQVPVERSGNVATAPESELSEAQRADRQKRSRAGLSINETVAGDTNLSVGSRGVDTSGVSAGAGAGAGMTVTTAGRSDSPAPNIVQGVRGSGTTVRADVQTTGMQSDPLTRNDADNASEQEISARAYECWHERGCPDGSPDVDWNRACDELRTRKQQKSMSASA